MFPRSIQLRAFAVFCLFAVVASAVQAQTVLQWKLTPGTVLNHSLTNDSDTSMSVGGQMINTKMTMAIETAWTVNGVEQGTADITQTFSGIKFKLASAAINLDYDSASEKEPTDPIGQQIAKSVKALAQSKFNFKLSPRGEISDVTVPDETKKLLEQVQLGPQMSGTLSPDGMIAMIKDSVIPFPTQPLQKGASWKHKNEMKAPPIGTMTNDVTLTYEGQATVGGKPLEQIAVQVASTLTADKSNPLVQVSIKEQSEQGKIYFDNAAGRLSHTESTQNMVLDVAAAGQKIEQSVKTIKKTKITQGTKK